MEKKFTAVTRTVPPRPRSKRRRETSGTVSGGGTVSVGGVSSAPSVMGDGHTHGNLSALNEISTDTDGYQYLTQLRETESPETGEAVVERVTEKVRAGYADVALDLSEDSPVREQFLSRLTDDVAKGKITFEQAIKVLGLATFGGGAQFGEFVKSLYAGKGAGIDADGNAEFESVRVRSYFECLELIINRLSAIEGDQILTEADTIESVEDMGGGVYSLKLRSKWDGYYTAQRSGNILKGIINTLEEGRGQYYTSWMRVNSVTPGISNTLIVTLYSDADTPAGKNYPPCADMRVARWGSQTDTTRQSCIYLSSTEGRIVRLTGVTKPKLEAENYGATFGTLPEFLRDMELPIVEGQDYVYARGLIVQDIIRVGYEGKPVSEVVDRGEWEEGAAYYCGALNPVTGVYETSDVWHTGCRWRCAKTGTSAAPAWNGTDWAAVEGDPRFTVEFADTERIFAPEKFGTTLSIVARKYNTDVTDIISDADVAWSRYSEDADGVQRAALDSRWATKRAGAGKTIKLTTEDCDMSGDAPIVLRFCAEVTLRDSKGNAAGTAQATFHVKFVRDGAAGKDGENGITVAVMPSSLTARVGVTTMHKVQVALYDGGNLVPYGSAEHGNFSCSGLPDSDKYRWRWTTEDGKFYYLIYVTPTDTATINIPFTATYKDMPYANTITIQPVADGKKGDRGPALRGPQAWSDCADGYAFQAGGEGEEWKDVVMFRDNYYSCTKSHAKTADNYPGSSTAEAGGLWQLGDKLELVATKILLSAYALVKNLGVEAIDMKDANGNVLFRAKDGVVTCRTGEFENVEVKSGKIAGFTVDGNYLTNTGLDNDASVVFENASAGVSAAIGGNVVAPSLGRVVARFENHGTTYAAGPGTNICMLVSARGAQFNRAILIDGGAVSGFAMNTRVISAGATSATLFRTDYNVIALNTSECVLTLPSMELYDNGHVIRIKKLASGTLKIKMSSCHTYNGSSDRSSMPVLMYDQTSKLTDTNTLTVANIGEAMELVWVRDIANTVNGTTYYGAWVQYKMPRNW